jgi:hypothetical protein
MANPKVGEMRLHDYILPPLAAGKYRLQVETQVRVDGAAQPLADQQAYFNIDGPRFVLAPNEVSGVFPPRNGHGPFDEAIPHLALGRRTLPWERPFAAARITVDNTPLNANGTPIPWMALLVFEDAECTVEVKQKIGDKLPADVVTRLGVPTDLLVDTVTAERTLVRNLMPAYAELALLAHVREVNVDDRELAAGDSDGFFAVIMGNRIPQRGKKYRCCLVSIEERTDIVPATPPAFAPDLPDAVVGGNLFFENADELFNTAGTRVDVVVDKKLITEKATGKQLKVTGKHGSGIHKGPKAQIIRYDCMVLLNTWTFECEGTASFRAIMQALDVGTMGKPSNGGPQLTDTGHMRVDIIDRAGAPERVFYRGPLAPHPLTRDTNGPYHSADQARRVAPDVGAEDISYACAFEVGRLLAAADARLAQELMRWRRDAYQRSLRIDTTRFVKEWVNIPEIIDPFWPLATVFATGILKHMVRGAGPLVNPFDLDRLSGLPGFDPAEVQRVYGLASQDEARALLGIGDGLLGSTVTEPGRVIDVVETLDDVLRDTVTFGRLDELRADVIENVGEILRGGGFRP